MNTLNIVAHYASTLTCPVHLVCIRQSAMSLEPVNDKHQKGASLYMNGARKVNN